MKKIIIIPVLVCCIQCINAQDYTADSLRRLIFQSKEDTGRVTLLRALGEYYFTTNTDSSLFYLQQSLRLSQQLNFTTGRLLVLKSMGDLSKKTGNISMASAMYKQALYISDSAGHNANNFRLEILQTLGNFYREYKPDSNIFYNWQCVQLSRKLKRKDIEFIALAEISIGYMNKGNYPIALDLSLKALQLAEQTGRADLIAKSHRDIGSVYRNEGYYSQALDHFLTAKKMAEPISDHAVLNITNASLGYCYMKMGRLDSALKYEQESYGLAMKYGDKFYFGFTLTNLANIYERMGERDTALAYYRQAEKENIQHNNLKMLCRTYCDISRFFQTTGASDSGIHYAKKALVIAQAESFMRFLPEAAGILTDVYKVQHKIDSAFKYQGIVITAKDSLFSQEKLHQLDMLTYNEQKRQEEIAEQKLMENETREKDLQLIGIAIFIPAFFGMLLLLSRRKVKPQTIEFLGLFALLLLFEFISLFIDPYISEWTHQTPVYSLLALVVVAAILAPTHNRLQVLMREKLVRKMQVLPASAESLQRDSKDKSEV